MWRRNMQTSERGMKKWMAFRSITDQYEGIRRILYDQKKIPRPILDEDKVDDINRCLVEAYNRKLNVTISYYDDGFIETCSGILKHISTVYRRIELTNQRKIPYTDIVDVEII